MLNAKISEIFSSVQGEGPWVGQRHIFVRFIGCDISCKYCDTRNPAPACSVQISADAFDRELLNSSISGDELGRLCRRLVISGPAKPWISLTGGEPLLQLAFLREWLPSAKNGFLLYLETNGIHGQAMTEIAPLIDIVSMDFKLPSATGLQPFWTEHARFLSAAENCTLFGKAVVTRDTDEQDVLHAARLLADSDRTRPLVIQPAFGMLAPGRDQLIRFQNRALALLADVRVIPQVHTMLNVP